MYIYTHEFLILLRSSSDTQNKDKRLRVVAVMSGAGDYLKMNPPYRPSLPRKDKLCIWMLSLIDFARSCEK